MKLTDKEKEYLRAVVKPFKDHIIGITKSTDCPDDKEFIWIESRLEDSDIMLPVFDKGTMYKNMIPDMCYSMEELELWD